MSTQFRVVITIIVYRNDFPHILPFIRDERAVNLLTELFNCIIMVPTAPVLSSDRIIVCAIYCKETKLLKRRGSIKIWASMSMFWTSCGFITKRVFMWYVVRVLTVVIVNAAISTAISRPFFLEGGGIRAYIRFKTTRYEVYDNSVIEPVKEAIVALPHEW